VQGKQLQQGGTVVVTPVRPQVVSESHDIETDAKRLLESPVITLHRVHSLAAVVPVVVTQLLASSTASIASVESPRPVCRRLSGRVSMAAVAVPWRSQAEYSPEAVTARLRWGFRGLAAAGAHWAGLGWAGLGWAGLGWAGLGWAGLGWAGLTLLLTRFLTSLTLLLASLPLPTTTCFVELGKKHST
jgi:hypothetical protein